jgi:hypothetical protein
MEASQPAIFCVLKSYSACVLNPFVVRFGHSGKLSSPWGAGALLE